MENYNELWVELDATKDLLQQALDFNVESYVIQNAPDMLASVVSLELHLKDGKPYLRIGLKQDEGFVLHVVERSILDSGIISAKAYSLLQSLDTQGIKNLASDLEHAYPDTVSASDIVELLKTKNSVPKQVTDAYREYNKVIDGGVRVFLSLYRDFLEAQRVDSKKLPFCHSYYDENHTGTRFFYDFLDTSSLTNRSENRLYVRVGSIDGVSETIVIPETDEGVSDLEYGLVTHTELIRSYLEKSTDICHRITSVEDESRLDSKPNFVSRFFKK